jgi:hypothetical protein
VGVIASRDGDAAVALGRELAGLEHGAEELLALDRAGVRAGLPQGPPAPDAAHAASRRHRVTQSLVGMGTVEDERRRLGVGDRLSQPPAQAPRPAVVRPGPRRRV